MAFGKYMTNKQIRELEQTVREQAIKDVRIGAAKSAHDIMLAVSIAILADVFGFGDVRIQRFTDAYNDLSDSLGVGQDDIETIKENIEYNFGNVFRKEQEQ